MSFQNRNDRKEGSRIPFCRNSNANPTQEWVPKGGSSGGGGGGGGGAGGGGGGSTAILETPPPQIGNLNSNKRNGGNWNNHPPHFGNRPRGGGYTVNQGKFAPRPSNPMKKENSGKNQVRKKSNSKLLPQLVHEIQEKLTKGTVECMICYDMVRRSAPIWSCSSCYSIFHLNCIKKWAQAPTSMDVSAERNHGLNWRCPGCQSVQLLTSKEIKYICFCGKRPDPPSDFYLTPHSCGESCGKPLERETELKDDDDDSDRCSHRCVLQCHPGPCPPCKAFAPCRKCPCGKKITTNRCSERKSVVTCGQRCDKVLECGRHQCMKLCHTGPCEICEVPMDASCFCKKKMEVILCGDMSTKGNLNGEDGVFSCNTICGKTLSCGNHTCGEICHPGQCGDCELMPWKIRTCYCGKEKLEKGRESCLEPIPTCSNICGKILPCRIHRCKEKCHGGDCSPCLVIVNQKCRCGFSSRPMECHKTMEKKDDFCCEKPCGRKKSCGRHRCSEKCCPLSNSNNQLSGEWNPHLCSIICGKKLRCGNHSCEALCHSGHCPSCLETSFTDLICACGKTSIPPPLPCGTAPPSCQYPCSVPQPCGHSSSHACHFGDCPPCSVPVAKECIGGHVVLRNIPCGLKEIRCNQLCGKTRQCGMHACGRTCHPPPCDSSCGSVSNSKSSCSQVCGAPRSDCRHTCPAPCHPSSPCPDLRCVVAVTIACSCGRITTTVPCGAGNLASSSAFEASVIQKLQVQLQPIDEDGEKIPLGQRKLVCDDECAKMERKRVLADAFDITPPNLDALHFGENSSVSELLANMFRREPKWVLAIEERFKFLVIGEGTKGGNGLKVHVFCPMLKDKRDAVAQIAERWKLSVHEAGWEPKKFLVVHVTQKSRAPPRILGCKGPTSINPPNPPTFDPFIDMDQRLVVALRDLPRDANVSALVLRFGGECELVWLNDNNALAVFNDPTRASTALRRLDHGSVYHGAFAVLTKDGGSGTSSKANIPWKKAVVIQDSCWTEDSWGTEEHNGGSEDTPSSVWKMKAAPIIASENRYNVLDPDTNSKSNITSVLPSELENPGKDQMGSCSSSPSASTSNLKTKQAGDDSGKGEVDEVVVVDDWEELTG